MRKRIEVRSPLFAAVFCMVFAAALAGCPGGGSPGVVLGVHNVTILSDGAHIPRYGSMSFTAVVSGEGISDASVTWSVPGYWPLLPEETNSSDLSGENDLDVKVSEDGRTLTIYVPYLFDQAVDEIIVQATSNQDSDVSGRMPVYIGDPVPYLLSFDIIPAHKSITDVDRGSTVNISYTMRGRGAFDRDLKWDIFEVVLIGMSPGTHFIPGTDSTFNPSTREWEGEGLLQIGADQIPGRFTIEAVTRVAQPNFLSTFANIDVRPAMVESVAINIPPDQYSPHMGGTRLGIWHNGDEGFIARGYTFTVNADVYGRGRPDQGAVITYRMVGLNQLGEPSGHPLHHASGIDATGALSVYPGDRHTYVRIYASTECPTNGTPVETSLTFALSEMILP
ncbi:MAG: hypothetical protein LBG93_05765 [Treponema sp.]|jgi:hypothetical protein|nr:hypothetical protein [Treponema sp.]